MVNESERESAEAAMRQINASWIDGRVDDMAPLVHPDVVLVVPGFSGTVQGRDSFLAGFHDFCQSAAIENFHEHDHRVDVAGNTAVVTFKYEMVYKRSGERYRATGRDLWVFHKEDKAWIAVWRAMLDMAEHPA